MYKLVMESLWIEGDMRQLMAGNRMRKHVSVICFALAGSISCATYAKSKGVVSSKSGERKPISVSELISNKKESDSKTVSVVGFLNLEMEAFGIFASARDLAEADENNGIWLDLNDEMAAKKALHKKKVIVVGVYDSKNTGHMEAWPNGGINVSEINETNLR